VSQLADPDPLVERVGVDREGQVALLVDQADLVRAGRGQDPGHPEVRAPDLGLDAARERADHVVAAAGGDQMVAGLRRPEHPLPAGAPAHPRAGLVRVDDRAAAHLFSDRGVGRPRSFDQALQRVLGAVLADREPEEVPTQLHQALVPDVMALVRVAQQRLDPRPSLP
jgi:hypothetical protein